MIDDPVYPDQPPDEVVQPLLWRPGERGLLAAMRYPELRPPAGWS
jgi:hypothetical protein